MAKVSVELIEVLRAAAQKLEASTDYQWGHMGACNCGFVAQEVTKYSKADIHTRAMMGHGDWNEQLNDYCPTSGLPMDGLISQLLDFGFDVDDLKHLERLSDPAVLDEFKKVGQTLHHNHKHDVVKYLRAWARLLEEELVNRVSLRDLKQRVLVTAER
ncbi:MAG: hypothetical protein ACOYW3_11670 [Bacteroidota bacterium]